MTFLRRHLAPVLISLLVAAGFAALLHAGALPLLPPDSAWEAFDATAIATYLALWSVVHVLRAARWTFLLSPLGHVPMRRILAVSFVGFAAIVFMPLRPGELVRPVLIRDRDQLSAWATTGTIAAERIIDGLMLSVMLLVSLTLAPPLDPLPATIGDLPISAALVPTAAWVATAIFGAALATIFVFHFAREWARRATATIVGRVSPRLAEWGAERVELLANGLAFLPRARLTVPFIAMTAAYWLINAWANALLARGCGFHDMTLVQGCTVTCVLALGILVPNAPGFFGAFQFSVYAALAMFYSPDAVMHSGALFVFTMYVAQMAVTLFAAALGFGLLPRGESNGASPPN